jgi:hypothetical protein
MQKVSTKKEENEIMIVIESENSVEKEILESNSSSTEFSNEIYLTDEESWLIHLPEKAEFNRKPGCYPDLKSKYKKKHNDLILKHTDFLKEKIVALVLDGRKMRTTRTLSRAGEKLKKIHVVELSPETFEIMRKRIKRKQIDSEKVEVYNCHIMDYVLRGVDGLINVIYMDVMCNFFDSNKTTGSQGIIIELLKQLNRPKILFASTFCLRTTIINFTYKREIEEILVNLHQIFENFGFKYTSLLKKNEMRYRGQSLRNDGMMFVLYKLEKSE